MAKLKIYTFPDLVLRQKAELIDRPDKSLHGLADDMLETMYFAPGIGLAANQVGILKQIIVVDTDYEPEDLEEEGIERVGDAEHEADPVFQDMAGAKRLKLKEKLEEKSEEEAGEIINGRVIRNKKPIILINPKIIYKEGSIVFCEGCLSVPEYSAEVKRAEKIKVEYQTVDGIKKILSAEGLQAICIQHELDHLDGKLFIDRLSPLKKEMAKKKLLRERATQESDDDSDEG